MKVEKSTLHVIYMQQQLDIIHITNRSYSVCMRVKAKIALLMINRISLCKRRKDIKEYDASTGAALEFF